MYTIRHDEPINELEIMEELIMLEFEKALGAEH